ncbi:hypothetical protein [Streptomyces sp. STR69]|uniref:hypothetical protein n=1 Tax=Streptomyces sp. STR69 TaxID=1796942 RepID=UPI0021CA7FBC|nr:hypothetical protein [Streptomyces sp. STR69]
MTDDVLFLSGDRTAFLSGDRITEPSFPHNSARPGIQDAAAARSVIGAAQKERP